MSILKALLGIIGPTFVVWAWAQPSRRGPVGRRVGWSLVILTATAAALLMMFLLTHP